MWDIKNIAITGSKGKTFTTRLLNSIFNSANITTLLVDSTGVYLEDEKYSNVEDSVKVFGKMPNVLPGRYIYGARKKIFEKLGPKALDQPLVCILETSIGSRNFGVITRGSKKLTTGLILNTYPLHAKTKTEVFERKKFIYDEIDDENPVIINLDDQPSSDYYANNKQKRNFITYSTELNTHANYKFDKAKKLIIGKSNSYSISNYKYSNNIKLISNLIGSIAILESINLLSKEQIQYGIESFKLPEEYGRTLQYKKHDRLLYLDYAHDAESLKNAIITLHNETKEPLTIVTRLRKSKVEDYFVKNMSKMLKSQEERIENLIIFNKLNKDYLAADNSIIKKDENSAKLLNGLKKLAPNFKVLFEANELSALSLALESTINPVLHIFANQSEVDRFLKARGFNTI